MSDPTPVPDAHEDFFRRQAWPEAWDESAFSPDQQRGKVFRRRWGTGTGTDYFLSSCMRRGPSWPWGYFIYRTTYGSDEDWSQALAKLHRYVHYAIRHQAVRSRLNGPEKLENDLEAAEVIWEGCQNVIVEDRELLEGASPTQVRRLFQEWMIRNPKYKKFSRPRSTYCLMIDEHAMRSILASSEPCADHREYMGAQPGYVILIDRRHPTEGGIKHEPYNVGWMRITMVSIYTAWGFTTGRDDLEFEDVYPAIGRRGLIPYYDGFRSWVEDVNGQRVEDFFHSESEEEEMVEEDVNGKKVESFSRSENEGENDVDEQDVKTASHSENGEEEDEIEDDEEDDYPEGGYPFHDIYEYLREKGHI
ncbi:uncharacterized protein LDX57_008774 [Aspergillus melleus]|uniref:uncharacterized protein n=1 Tax=Aspergillus melleus TaxID=138277 RepID=UPI001E8D8A7C|nr:uncharacterized protein LDX57_008774 [Aspergillus melleus]KAH8431113.1 hypothetical protein LDX57_008774 [Aspergillus melleus]